MMKTDVISYIKISETKDIFQMPYIHVHIKIQITHTLMIPNIEFGGTLLNGGGGGLKFEGDP